GSNNGIFVPAAQRNLRIRNGSAQSWGGYAIYGKNATNSQFDHLRVSQNAGDGLLCGDGNVLSEVNAEANGIFGIETGNSCTVTASIAVSNLHGFSTLNQCTIIRCTAVS